MKLTDQQLTTLKALIAHGRKLTHTPDCTSHDTCPSACACNNSLNLATAMAWSTATYLDNLTFTKRIPKQTIFAVQDIVAGYLSAVSFHRDEYEPLYCYLVEVAVFLRGLTT